MVFGTGTMRLMCAVPSLSTVVRWSDGGAWTRACKNHPAGRVNTDAKELLVISHDSDSSQPIRIQDFLGSHDFGCRRPRATGLKAAPLCNIERLCRAGLRATIE